MGKNLQKILNILKKLKKSKKKKYSLDSLLRIYNELAKQELEANKRRNIQYIYIQQPREYFFDKTKITECEEKSIWDIDLPIINNKLLGNDR